MKIFITFFQIANSFAIIQTLTQTQPQKLKMSAEEKAAQEITESQLEQSEITAKLNIFIKFELLLKKIHPILSCLSNNPEFDVAKIFGSDESVKTLLTARTKELQSENIKKAELLSKIIKESYRLNFLYSELKTSLLSPKFEIIQDKNFEDKVIFYEKVLTEYLDARDSNMTCFGSTEFEKEKSYKNRIRKKKNFKEKNKFQK